MFCVKCGKELPDDSQFCSKCGANLSPIDNKHAAGTQIELYEGKFLLAIERQKAFGGMASKIKVFIDGSMVKELSNGEAYSKELSNGKHHLFCDAFLMDRSQTFEFEGNSNEIAFSVSFAKSTVIWGTRSGKKTVTINKIRETRPGTYKENNP